MATKALDKDKQNDTDIEQSWKCIIKRKYSDIIDYLDIVATGGLTDRLLSVDVISLSHKEQIYAKSTREDKARALVDTVIDQGEHGCKMFVQQMGQLEPLAMKDLHRELDNLHSSQSKHKLKETSFDQDILKAWSLAQKDDYTPLFSSLPESISEDMKMRLGPINKWIDKAREELLQNKSQNDKTLVNDIYTKVKECLFNVLTGDAGDLQSTEAIVSHRTGQLTEIKRLILAEFLRKVSESAAQFVLNSITDEEKQISIRVFEFLKMRMLHCFEHLPIPFETTRESNELKIALIDGNAFTTYERTFYVNMNSLVPYKTPIKRSRVKSSNLFHISFDKTKSLRCPSDNNAFNCFRPVRMFEYLGHKDGRVAGRIGRDHDSMCYMSQVNTFKFLKAHMKDHFPGFNIQDGILKNQPCLYFTRMWGERTFEVYTFVPSLSLPIVSTSGEGKEGKQATKEYSEEFVFDSFNSSSEQCAMRLNRTGAQTQMLRKRGFNFSKILSLTKCYFEEEHIYLDDTLIGNAMLWTVNDISEHVLMDELSYTVAVILQLSKQSKQKSYCDYITPDLNYFFEQNQEQKLAQLEDVTVNKLIDRCKVCEISSPKSEYTLVYPNENDYQGDDTDGIDETKVVVDSIDQLILNPNQNNTSARLFKTCMTVFSCATYWLYTAVYNVNVKWKLADIPAEIIRQILVLGLLLNLCFLFSRSKFVHQCSLASCFIGITCQLTGVTSFVALEDTLLVLFKYCINRWEIMVVVSAILFVNIKNFFENGKTMRSHVVSICTEGEPFVVYCHALKERNRDFWNMATVKMGGNVGLLIWLWNSCSYVSWGCIKLFRLSVTNFPQSKVARRTIPLLVTFLYVYLFKMGTVFGHQRDLRFGLVVFLVAIIALKSKKHLWYFKFLSFRTDITSRVFFYILPIPLPFMFQDPVRILANISFTPLHVIENIEDYARDLFCPFNLCLLFTAYKIPVYLIGMIVVSASDMPYSIVTGGVNFFDMNSIIFVYSISYFLVHTLHLNCTFTEPVEDIFFDAVKAPSSCANRSIDFSKIPRELLALCAIEGFNYLVFLKCVSGALPHFVYLIWHYGVWFVRIYFLQQSNENVTLEMFDDNSKS